MADNINPINYNFSIMASISIDQEYKMIIRKLIQYGLKPSGNKSHDKMRLHEIELREAKKQDTVTTKFLTVSQNEQEKIQEKKKNKRIETDPKSHLETMKGQRILGEQIMLAIKMKKELKYRYSKTQNEYKNKKI